MDKNKKNKFAITRWSLNVREIGRVAVAYSHELGAPVMARCYDIGFISYL
jgi:hypothetical protein